MGIKPKPKPKLTNMPTIKLCKDCVSYHPDDDLPNHIEYAKCSHNCKIDPIHGKKLMNGIDYCSVMRKFEHKCGPEAKFFEPIIKISFTEKINMKIEEIQKKFRSMMILMHKPLSEFKTDKSSDISNKKV